MAQHDIVVSPLAEASATGSNASLIQWEECSSIDVWYNHVACVGLIEAKLPDLLYPEIIDFDPPEKA